MAYFLSALFTELGVFLSANPGLTPVLLPLDLGVDCHRVTMSQKKNRASRIVAVMAVLLRWALSGLHRKEESMNRPELNSAAFDYYGQLARLREYIVQNLSEQLTAAHAASIAGIATKYFSTFFHTRVGITFSCWLRSVRVARAMELFARRDYSVTETAGLVGFADLTAFERAFKRSTGLSPLQFKKQIRPFRDTGLVTRSISVPKISRDYLHNSNHCTRLRQHL
jgi:AraC-like DNA-binding protein